jgi:hypothetical protein
MCRRAREWVARTREHENARVGEPEWCNNSELRFVEPDREKFGLLPLYSV